MGPCSCRRGQRWNMNYPSIIGNPSIFRSRWPYLPSNIPAPSVSALTAKGSPQMNYQEQGCQHSRAVRRPTALTGFSYTFSPSECMINKMQRQCLIDHTLKPVFVDSIMQFGTKPSQVHNLHVYINIAYANILLNSLTYWWRKR